MNQLEIKKSLLERLGLNPAQYNQLKFRLKRRLGYTVLALVPLACLTEEALYVTNQAPGNEPAYRTIARAPNYVSIWRCSSRNGEYYRGQENWIPYSVGELETIPIEPEEMGAPLFDFVAETSPAKLPQAPNFRPCTRSLRKHRRDDHYSWFEYDPREGHVGRLDCVDLDNIFVYCPYHYNWTLYQARKERAKTEYEAEKTQRGERQLRDFLDGIRRKTWAPY